MGGVNWLVSVIIPAYNCERYIVKSVSSVLNQTYSNIEIIIIDDGSTDNTPMLCDELEVLHSNIVVVHKKNEGVSVARNVGLRHATGEYIVFIDADDEMMPDMVSFLLENIESEKADISICGVRIIEPDGRMMDEFGTGKKEVLQSEEALKRMLLGMNFNTGLWTKMFRKHTIKDVLFEKGIRMHEDKYFIFRALLTSKVIVIEDVSKYIYVRNDASVTKRAFNDRWFDISIITEKIQNDILKFRPGLASAVYFHSLQNYYVLLNMVARKKEIKRQYNTQFHKVLELYKKLPVECISQTKSISRKVNFLLLKYCPSIYCWLKRK